MKKKITIIFLLFLITFLGIFIFLKLSVNGAEDNIFNTNWRYKFARYKIFRKTLSLHYDGDARSDYLGKKQSEITLKVVLMEGLYFDQDILIMVGKKIQEITGKPTLISYAVKKIPFSQESKLSDLATSLQEVRSYESGLDRAMIFLVIANQNEMEPSNIGSTLQEDGLVFFEGDINKSYSQEGDIQSYQQYAVSVLMHEFGHQLGLPHNELEGCLMNKQLEINAQEKREKISIDFCEQEKKAIKNMQI